MTYSGTNMLQYLPKVPPRVPGLDYDLLLLSERKVPIVSASLETVTVSAATVCYCWVIWFVMSRQQQAARDLMDRH